MPNGGYVPENCIALCGPCHALAERFHATRLYAAIGPAPERAHAASLRLRR